MFESGYVKISVLENYRDIINPKIFISPKTAHELTPTK